MGRPIRIYYPGLIYHILNRGNNRQVTFVVDQDYRHYLDILQRYKEKFAFKQVAQLLTHCSIIIKKPYLKDLKKFYV